LTIAMTVSACVSQCGPLHGGQRTVEVRVERYVGDQRAAVVRVVGDRSQATPATGTGRTWATLFQPASVDPSDSAAAPETTLSTQNPGSSVNASAIKRNETHD
jgi:hypothetical protein